MLSQCCLGRRLLHATLPELQLLQDVRIFAVGGLTTKQLALLADLLQRYTSLRELSVSFAPEPSFVAQDLDVFGGCGSRPAYSAFATAADLQIRHLFGRVDF